MSFLNIVKYQNRVIKLGYIMLAWHLYKCIVHLIEKLDNPILLDRYTKNKIKYTGRYLYLNLEQIAFLYYF